MKEGDSMVKAYVPFRFRYTPIVKTVLIKFKKDPDHAYNALELQVFELNGERFYQVLAKRHDDYKDVYQDPKIQLDEGELELNIGGRGMGDVYPTTFTKGYFEEKDGHIRIGFTFNDKDDRLIKFAVDENLEKDTNHLAWLPSIGASLETPQSVPLFFLYDFDFIRKAGTDVKLEIDGVKHTVDPYAIAKDFQARINIQYSLNSVVANFNETRESTMPVVELDEHNMAEYNGKKYHYNVINGRPQLAQIVLQKGSRPVKVTFDPPFPDFTEIKEHVPKFGEFIIQPAEELGTLTGRYNVTKQNNKVMINLSFTEGWQPNQKELYYKLLRERASGRLTDWYKEYQCSEVVDLDTLETKVEWKKVNPERTKGI